jgi:hypothetical protein
MCAAALAMVNYYLQKFLPHPESILVGIDEQFENAVSRPVGLVGIGSGGDFNRVVFVSSPNSP